MSKLQTVVTLLILVFVAGCSTMKDKVDAQTEQLFSPSKPAFLDPVKGPPILKTLEDSYFCPANDAKTRAAVRDKFLLETTADIDRQFTKFYSEQYVGRTFTDLTFDLLNLGAGFAGTVMGGKFDKTVASALVTLFTGTKLSVQENLYNKQAVLAVMSKMESQRLLVGAQINSNQRGTSVNNQPVNQDDYNLAMAVSDAKKYYDAGTIMGALVALNDTAATDKNVAQDTSQKVKEGKSFNVAHDEAQRSHRGLSPATQPMTPLSPSATETGAQEIGKVTDAADHLKDADIGKARAVLRDIEDAKKGPLPIPDPNKLTLKEVGDRIKTLNDTAAGVDPVRSHEIFEAMKKHLLVQ